MFVVFVLLLVVHSQANDGIITDDHKVDVDPYGIIRTTARQYSGRQIFDFRKNGLRVDIRVVPSSRNDSSKDDGFPEFPTKDIGHCIINLSLVCARKRLGRFLESIRELNEIYLMGQRIKLVKTRVNVRRSSSGVNDTIERSVNDFFDTFALRITLPRWNGQREKNQIDIMFDETAVSEGRGKGGGGGGKGGKGGKCKMMMMAGLMMLKMKLMGVATMKGMMMAGMSLMISMAMLMQKYMKGGGGGGYGGGGGGQFKEVVILTKATGGGGGGGDSYGPPSSGYGPPSGGGGYGGGGGGYGGGGGGYGGGGGGGYGGGGGWGRSFGRRFITTNYDQTNHNIGSTNASFKTENPIPNMDNRFPSINSNYSYSIWNSSDYDEPQRYQYLINNNMMNRSDMEPLLRTGSDNYAIDTDPYQNVDSKVHVVTSRPIDYVNSLNHVGSINHIANNYDTNVAGPIYGNEWQASEEVFPSNLKGDTREGKENFDNDDPSIRAI